MKTFLHASLKFFIQQVLVGLVVGGAILCFQVIFGAVTKPAIGANIWAFATPYLLLIVLLIGWQMVRTAYVLYTEDQAKIRELSDELSRVRLKPMLMPLQIEILRITRSFREFLAELGPAPIEPTNAISVEFDEWAEQRSKWARRLIYVYKDRFSGDLRHLVNSLGSLGMNVSGLNAYVDYSFQSEEACQDLLRRLFEFICKLEGRAVDGRVEVAFEQPEMPKELAWAGYESEEAWHSAIDAQNKLIDMGRSVEGILTTLQIEALSLARELQEFVKQHPAPKKVDFGWDQKRQSFRNSEMVGTFHNARRAIEEKLHAAYALNFQARSKNLFQRFAESGLTDRHLGTLVDAAKNQDEMTDLVRTIRLLAFRLEEVQR